MVEDSNANRNNDVAGTLVTPGSLQSGSIADQINRRTHIIDKLYAAVETGGGNDYSGRSKTGFQWYNEALDGITCIVISSEIPVGLSNADATGQIETVEDP